MDINHASRTSGKLSSEIQSHEGITRIITRMVFFRDAEQRIILTYGGGGNRARNAGTCTPLDKQTWNGM